MGQRFLLQHTYKSCFCVNEQNAVIHSSAAACTNREVHDTVEAFSQVCNAVITFGGALNHYQI